VSDERRVARGERRRESTFIPAAAVVPGDRRAAPLERKGRRLERHLDEHAIPVRARDDGHARRDLQGLHDFEERQDHQDQDRRGQALVEMTVVDRAGLSLGFQ
jgi:hypothetical protein